MWNNNFHQQPSRGGYPWQRQPQHPPVINGQNGPLGIPRPHETYETNPQYMPGARGFNAAYNQLNQQNNDWFNQTQNNSVQYTSAQKPSYWDAFGYGSRQVQHYSDGKATLNLQDVQEAFKTNQHQAQSVLNALDVDGDCGLNDVEMATFTLLSDSPGSILWNVTQANKNNPNYPNRLQLTQLEDELKRALQFDNQGNPVSRPADGRIDPADRELLNKAMALVPDLVRATVQEMRRSLNLDGSYSQYRQASQRWENTFKAPQTTPYGSSYNPAYSGGYPQTGFAEGNAYNNPYNQYGGVNVPPNPWQNLNWLTQQQGQGSHQIQLYLLMMMLSVNSGQVNGGGYQANNTLPWGNMMGQMPPYHGSGQMINYPWVNQPLSVSG
jgi:hypothetical protein